MSDSLNRMLAIFILFTMHRLCGVSSSAESDTPSRLNFTGPICLENILIFECSVIGGGSTVWSGNVFNCKSADNSIVLLHSRYNISVISSCNGGAVVGQSLYVEDDQYTSQLMINVTINYSALIERDITCTHDAGNKTYVVGCHTLSSNDFSCSNDHTEPGNGDHSLNTTMLITLIMGCVLLAAVIMILAGAVLIKKSFPCKKSFVLNKHGTCLSEVEACASPTVIGMKLGACDDKSLYSADVTIAPTVHQLPACDDDCNPNDEEEQLDLDCLLMKLRGRVDAKLWYQFGMAIGVPTDVLETLKGYDEEECMIELADYWLRNHPAKPTWNEICNAAKKFANQNLIQPANDYMVIQDMPGTKQSQSAYPQEVILNYTAVIPKSIRSCLQRSMSPPPIPPRIDQQNS